MSTKYHDIPTATVVNDNAKYSGYGSVNNKKYDDTGEGVEWSKGELQPPAFRDVGFNIVFWAQLLTILILGILYMTGFLQVDWEMNDSSVDGGSTRRLLMVGGNRLLKQRVQGNVDQPTEQNEDEELDIDFSPLMWASLFSVLTSPFLTICVLSYTRDNAAWLIQMAIYFSIAVNVFLAILCLVSGLWFGTLVPIFGAFITYLYARAVWHRIPYAAANLKTAITPMQSQLGVPFLGIASIPIYILWWLLWIYVFAATLNTPFMKSQVQSTKVVNYNGQYQDNEVTLEEKYSGVWWTIIVFFLLSFYWTNQVVGNVVKTTVAGAVGTWWFVPDEAQGFCSPALSSSLFRSMTFSFGSICFGSLLVAIIQTLRALVQNAAQSTSDDQNCGTMLRCLAQCLLDLIDQLAEYFNNWAFVYVGLYGYTYLEAATNVMTLFGQRGWTTIITDDLTSRVMGLMSFTVGLATALIAVVIAAILSISSSYGGVNVALTIPVALIIGVIMSSMIFGVVTSGLYTVIVLFAEAPYEFEQNHPQLSYEMNEAWAQAWPDIFSPVRPTVLI